MPHTKVDRHFSKARAGVNGPVGRHIIRYKEMDVLAVSPGPITPRGSPVIFKGTISTTKPLITHFLRLKRSKNNKMRPVNIEFRSMDSDRSDEDKETCQPLTTTLTFSDYLCKWCLTYVGQRRQFCSADCAAQFKLCQRRRDQKQVCSLLEPRAFEVSSRLLKKMSNSISA